MPRTVTSETSVAGDGLVTARLSQGLKVYVWPKPGFRKVYATYSTRYGSIDSAFILPPGRKVEVPDGIAHFLEHKVFEEEDGVHAFEKFAGLGASSNAYTNYTHTAYLFSTTWNFQECLDTLLEFVSRLHVTDESVRKEKGIIEQEILMYADMPEHVAFQNLMKAMYHKHPVRLDIAGSVESVRSITKEDLELCHGAFYHPSNMALFVAGDVDPGAVVEQVERFLSAKGFQARPSIRRIYPEEPASVREREVQANKDVTRPYVRIGFKDPVAGLSGLDLLKKELVTEILVDLFLGKGSALHEKLYDEGLIDERFSSGVMMERDYGCVLIAAETGEDRKLVEELLSGIDSLKERYRLGKAEEPLEAGFERIRKKTWGQMVRMLDFPEAVAYEFNKGIFTGYSPFDRLEQLEKLSPEEAYERMQQCFDLDRCSVSIVRP